MIIFHNGTEQPGNRAAARVEEPVPHDGGAGPEGFAEHNPE